MIPNGYIRLHRRILTSNLWHLKPHQIMVALVCLLKAQWQDAKVRGFEVRRGQWLTHYDAIRDLCPGRVSSRQIRHSIKRLASKEIGFLDTQVVTRFGRRFLLITICKYEEYQGQPDKVVTRFGGELGSRLSHGCHTSVTTIKEEVKEREKDVNDRGCGNGGYVDNSDPIGKVKVELPAGSPSELIAELAGKKALDNIALVDRIIELTGDTDSQGYYERRVRQIPHGKIERMLGAVKEAISLGEIRKSPGALLAHLMEQEIRDRTEQGG